MPANSQAASRGQGVPRGTAELAALEGAIVPLIRSLGGTEVPGPWDFTANRLRLQHRPGAGISAIYRMPAGTGFAELGLSTEVLHVPGTASVTLHVPAGPSTEAAQAAADGRQPQESVTVTGWIHPNDPMLPALATALDGKTVSGLWGRTETLQSLRTIAYRPLRRAVIKATFRTLGPLRIDRTIFLKVGREPESAGLLARHRIMEGSSIPVPRVLDPNPSAGAARHAGTGGVPGIVALEAGPGEGLAATIRRTGPPPAATSILPDGAIPAAGFPGSGTAGASLPEGTPDPEDFIALLDALPQELMALPARRAWTDGLGRYRVAAALALPQQAGRIAELVGRIEHLVKVSNRGGLVPTHGDFYEANILMQDGRISALLDLDSLGPGYRVDDLACLLGHLAILPSIAEKNLPAVAALEKFGAAFERTVDPVALWTRAGAVALTLVAGARTSGTEGWVPAAEARLRAAEKLVDRAAHHAATRASVT